MSIDPVTRWRWYRLIVVLFVSLLAVETRALAGKRVDFDSDWRFQRGDFTNAERSNFNDGGWTRVDLPHDWAIAGPFDANALGMGSYGFLPTGVAWYRKHFSPTPQMRGKRVFVEFDGVMERSGVWINGMHVGYRPSGYAGFRYEITPHLRRGENVIAVRADTSAQPASRWYAGGGIYRHVRLVVTGDVHVDTDGLAITTPIITSDSAAVRVRAQIVNQAAMARRAHLEIELSAPDGKRAGTMRGGEIDMPAGRTLELTADGSLANPRRWDLDRPSIYRALVRVVSEDGVVLDEEAQTFGVRDMRFEAATGFWLNGRNIKLKGVAIHADGGALGMAVPLAFYERRLRGLKALGVNAIRTAHHPFGPEFLDLCDRLGLIVMDEAFDMWTVAKNPQDYHLFFTDWSSIDARAMARRDRNHPSIALWSIGNEIHDTPYPLVAKSIVERLKAIFHEEDPSRPVTMALFRPNTTSDYQNGLADLLDVVGQNYREIELAKAHADKPTRRIVGTENSKNRASWLVVRDDPAYAGMFLWTGVDYLGEADRSGWPAISNPSGLVDRTDWVKPVGRERASWWSDAPIVSMARRVTEVVDISEMPTMTGVALPQPKGPGALADWSPARRDAHPETVEVYSNAPEVELVLNGRSLGRKPRPADDSARQWTVPFAPGMLRAIAWRGRSKIGEDMLRTAGPAAALRVISENAAVGRGFDALGFVGIEVVDAHGVRVPDAAVLVTIAVEGGTLAAFDNGSVTDHTPFASPTRSTVDGHALAMVRPGASDRTLLVTASAPGLTTASTRIAVR